LVFLFPTRRRAAPSITDSRPKASSASDPVTGQVQDQIDGLIALDGQPILVEALGTACRSAEARSRGIWYGLYSCAGVLGLFVSSSPYTDPAITECENLLSLRAQPWSHQP
jgi:hypothetical protein